LARSKCPKPSLHRTQKRLDPERIARLIADYEAGEPVNNLAMAYGIHRSTVLEHLKRQGIRGRRTRLTPPDIEKIVGLCAAEESVEAIAHDLRVGDTTVRRALKKFEVPLKARGRPPRRQ